MRRFLVIAFCLLALAIARTSQAENCFSRCWHDFWAATHRNNAWPEPFIPSDRYSVRAPFATCVANGWRAQNTLVDFHFDDDTGKLNEAGELKVRTILTYTPPAYRTVFVLRADKADITANRIDTVQQAALRFTPPGEAPPVIDTIIEPRTTPADYIVDIDRSFRETTPSPRIPEGSASSSPSSSSNGASGT